MSLHELLPSESFTSARLTIGKHLFFSRDRNPPIRELVELARDNRGTHLLVFKQLTGCLPHGKLPIDRRLKVVGNGLSRDREESDVIGSLVRVKVLLQIGSF